MVILSDGMKAVLKKNFILEELTLIDTGLKIGLTPERA